MLTDTDSALQARVTALEAELAATKEALRHVAFVSQQLVRHRGIVGHMDLELRKHFAEVARLLGPAVTQAAHAA